LLPQRHVNVQRAVTPSGAGRPTRKQAEERHAQLLNGALDIFLDRGYEQATIEVIAASVSMTKRTIYARYEDKAALFRAAVQQAIERWIVPDETLRSLERHDLETTLMAVARMRILHVMTPEGMKLQRIINAESYRFPDIFTSAYEQATAPVIEFLAAVLRRHRAAGEVSVSRPRMAAIAFLSMVVGGPVRILSTGARLDPRDLEDRIAFSVSLFLDGVKSR
jgi:TetR/AcrR family transcriptional regulator, mexJK operon transcriptional repressor